MCDLPKEEAVIDKDQYVKFIASPPKQINIAIPPRGFENAQPTRASAGQYLTFLQILAILNF